MGLPFVILAAGSGRRLGSQSRERPKCLLQVRGRTLLERTLGDLTALGYTDVVALVIGHAGEMVRAHVEENHYPFVIRLIENPRFASTNNIVSAALARERLGDELAHGFVLMNADVLCHVDVLRLALAGPAECALIVDPTKPVREEAMKARFENGRLVAIGKDLDPDTCDGEFIGLAQFDEAGAEETFRAIERLLADGREGEWYEAAIAEAARLVPFGMRSIGGLPWIEIDDPDDLRRAERDIAPALDLARAQVSLGRP